MFSIAMEDVLEQLEKRDIAAFLCFLCGLAIVQIAWVLKETQGLSVRERNRERVLRAEKRKAFVGSLEDALKEEEAPVEGGEVLKLESVPKRSRALVGGKAESLSILARNGFRVPNTFCVSRVGVNALLNGSEADQERVRQAIVAEYRNLSRDGKPAVVAVRSSAVLEDSDTASFAGQFESYLGIKGDEQVLSSVMKCIASACTQGVQAYQKSILGLNAKSQEQNCCVLIQRLILPSCSGVCFTLNPISQNPDEVVITSSWGLGESIVADLVKPDTWRVSKPSKGKKVLESEISSSKFTKVVHNPSSGGTETVSVSTDQRESASLSLDQVFLIVEECCKIESVWGTARDIEWAFEEGTGDLFILQSRAITTTEPGIFNDDRLGMNEFDSPCDPTDWLTTCNAREMFPGAGTPLSISTFGRAANYALQAMQVSFGVREEINESERLVGWFYGCQFLNMTKTLRPMCSGMVGSELAKENGEMSILGRVNGACSVSDVLESSGPPEPSLLKKLVNGFRYMISSLLATTIRVPRLRDRVEIAKRFLSSKEYFESSQLWEDLDEMHQLYLDQWADGVTVSSTSAAYMLLLMKLMCFFTGQEAWGAEVVADVSRLIRSEGVESVAESCDAVKSLDQVATQLCSTPKSAKIFLERIGSGDSQSALDWLQAENELFRIILEKHGHRCIKEAEMRAIEWREDPSPLLQVLAAAIAMRQKREDGVEPSRLNQLDKNFVLGRFSFIQRHLFSLVASFARSGVRNRELGKSLCIAFHTECKRGYRKLGILLHKEGIVPDADLVYFFTHDELGTLSHPNLPHSKRQGMVKTAARRRRLLPVQERLCFLDLQQGKPHPVLAETQQPNSDRGLLKLKGTIVCTGVTRGRARVVQSLQEASSIQQGEILICPQTDVGWTPYFTLAAGLVTELGGLLSHGAVVAREYGLPCVVNVQNACTTFETGQLVELDATKGIVTKVDQCDI